MTWPVVQTKLSGWQVIMFEPVAGVSEVWRVGPNEWRPGKKLGSTSRNIGELPASRHFPTKEDKHDDRNRR